MAALFFKPFGDFFCPEDRPSPIFSTFNVCINAIGGILGLVGLFDAAPCPQHIKTWIILGLVTMFGNAVFAFYLYFRFASKVKELGSGSAAASKMFLYDWGVCFYIMFLIWQIIWMILAGNKSMDTTANCKHTLDGMVIVLVLYFIIGALLIIFSLMTECCRTPTWQGTQGRSARTGAAARTTAAPQQVFAAPAPGRQAQYQQGPSPIIGGGAQPQQQPAYGQPAGYPTGGGGGQPAGYPAARSAGSATPPASNPNYRPAEHAI